LKVITNTFKQRNKTNNRVLAPSHGSLFPPQMGATFLPQKTKLLAWAIFLVFFIENGTLGLLPRQLYFIYRNVRVSDFLIYGLTIYSLYNVKEFSEYYKSPLLIIIKVLFVYLLFQFIISTILYNMNAVEYFFRLKGVWSSFLVFPYMLLLKRGGFPYLIKLILPVAIVSNILYILSSLTGIAFLPEIGIEKQSLPGGLEVFRVYGGTFFGEIFFLGFIYTWMTKRFRLYQLGLVILFVLPHILAFGRSAWVQLIFAIILMFLWYNLKKREFKLFVRQAVLIVLLLMAVIYAFTTYIPQSKYLTEAIGARILQGQEDVKYEKGTYGTRMANINMLIDLWLNSNILFGIGMHPMWVIKPETELEVFYAWGFSDVRWASVLTAYGLVGFLIAVIFQVQFFIIIFKLLRKVKTPDIYVFFLLLTISQLMFDTLINYSFFMVTVSLWGLSMRTSFYVANVVHEYVRYKHDKL
jgi:hypothetical protein